MSDPIPGVWGRPRETSAGLYRGLLYKPGHAYKTNPRHREGNRGNKRRVREAEEGTREAEEDKESDILGRPIGSSDTSGRHDTQCNKDCVSRCGTAPLTISPAEGKGCGSGARGCYCLFVSKGH